MSDKQLVRPQIAVLSQDQMAQVHDYALRVLSSAGVCVDSERGRQLFARAGATVHDDNRVYIPRELVDEAFLRRIPYKIEVVDPSEEEFRELFKMMAAQLGFEFQAEPLDYLITEHYHKVWRSFRCCHPRDLLLQVKSFCAYMNEPHELTPAHLDAAVENYFAVM